MQQEWTDKPRNLVAKNLKAFNKSAVQVDRKKAFKRGKIKHKDKHYGF